MGAPGGPPGLDAILNELRLAVQALNELAAALRDAALSPPVQMQVERLEVETLEFHLGDIDVEQLEGELNIGITHSLKVEGPKAEPNEGSTPQPGEAHRMKPGGPGPQTLPQSVVTRWLKQGGPKKDATPPGQVTIWPPPETEGKGKRDQDDSWNERRGRSGGSARGPDPDR